MTAASSVASFARFLRQLYGALSRPVTLDRARETIARQLESRDARWLAYVERTVFDNARSPYLPLMVRAGCELGDLRASVAGSGLEATLRRLRDEGVYVSLDEFKGRRPIVRGDLVVDVRAEDFDDPAMARGLVGSTGGTSGPGTSVPLTVPRIVDSAAPKQVALHAHGIPRARTATWRGFAYGGLIHSLTDAAMGRPHERWFAPPRASRAGSGLFGDRVALASVRIVARAAGSHVPNPEWTAYGEPGVVAEWAGDAARDGALLATGVSLAVRIAGVAKERGLDLTGLSIFMAGEPATPAKLAAVREVGIRCLPFYSLTDAGRIAIGCANPSVETDMHLVTNLFAITQHPKEIPAAGMSVGVLALTSLAAGSVKVLLNTETDDYGEILDRRCGCLLEEAGFTEHVSNIYSFGKLTGEGVTLVGTDVQRILEDVLPRRFGGTAVDYQLVEEEDENGYTRVNLIVSPRVPAGDDRQIIETFMESLGPSGLAADVRTIWGAARTMRVRREEPVVTAAGKVLPLVPVRLDRRRHLRPTT